MAILKYLDYTKKFRVRILDCLTILVLHSIVQLFHNLLEVQTPFYSHKNKSVTFYLGWTIVHILLAGKTHTWNVKSSNFSTNMTNDYFNHKQHHKRFFRHFVKIHQFITVLSHVLGKNNTFKNWCSSRNVSQINF